MRTDWSVSICLGLAQLAGCAATRSGDDHVAQWEAALLAESAKAERPVAEGPALHEVPIRKDRLTVEEAVADGLAHNRSVKESRLGVLIGGTFETEARSRLLPTLSGRVRYTRVDTPPMSDAPELGTSFSIGPRSVWSGALDLGFSIYAFGRHINAFRAARLDRRRAEADQDTTEADIAAAVTAAAFDLLEAIRGVGVAKSNVKMLAQQVADSQALLDEGRVTRAALLDAQVNYDVAVRGEERLVAAVPVLRMRLNQLLGRPAHAKTEIIDDPVTRAPIWQQRSLEEEALLRRPELRSARLAMAALGRTLRSVIGGELGEVRGNVTYDADNNEFRSPNDRLTLLLTLDVPIFTAGGRAARIRRARYALDVSQLALRDLETRVRTEVANAFTNVEQTYADIAVAARSIDRSEVSLEIQREKFRNGRATSREVLDATTQLNRARLAHVVALYSYNVALRALHRARGADPRLSPFHELPEKAAAGGKAPK